MLCMGDSSEAQKRERRRRAREVYAQNPAKRLAQNKAWRDANKARIAAARKATYDAEEQRVRAAKWYASNAKRVVESTKQWRKNNPEAHKKNTRKYHLKKHYGLTPEQYAVMRKAQHGRCAICRRRSPRRLHVDHCHRTGRLRALLCNRCNLGIGYFDDCPALMRKAAAYLMRHRNG